MRCWFLISKQWSFQPLEARLKMMILMDLVLNRTSGKMKKPEVNPQVLESKSKTQSCPQTSKGNTVLQPSLTQNLLPRLWNQLRKLENPQRKRPLVTMMLRTNRKRKVDWLHQLQFRCKIHSSLKTLTNLLRPISNKWEEESKVDTTLPILTVPCKLQALPFQPILQACRAQTSG